VGPGALKDGLALLIFKVVDAVDAVTVFVKLIVAELITDIPRQGKKDSDAYRKADDIDECE
jgi:hypothetical protein